MTQSQKPAHAKENHNLAKKKKISTLKTVLIVIVVALFGLFIFDTLVQRVPDVAHFVTSPKIDRAYDSSLALIEPELKVLGLTFPSAPPTTCKSTQLSNDDWPLAWCSRKSIGQTAHLDKTVQANWPTHSNRLHKLLLENGWKESENNSATESLEGLLEENADSFSYHKDFHDFPEYFTCSFSFSSNGLNDDKSLSVKLYCTNF